MAYRFPRKAASIPLFFLVSSPLSFDTDTLSVGETSSRVFLLLEDWASFGDVCHTTSRNDSLTKSPVGLAGYDGTLTKSSGISANDDDDVDKRDDRMVGCCSDPEVIHDWHVEDPDSPCVCV